MLIVHACTPLSIAAPSRPTDFCPINGAANKHRHRPSEVGTKTRGRVGGSGEREREREREREGLLRPLSLHWPCFMFPIFPFYNNNNTKEKKNERKKEKCAAKKIINHKLNKSTFSQGFVPFFLFYNLHLPTSSYNWTGKKRLFCFIFTFVSFFHSFILSSMILRFPPSTDRLRTRQRNEKKTKGWARMVCFDYNDLPVANTKFSQAYQFHGYQSCFFFSHLVI